MIFEGIQFHFFALHITCAGDGDGGEDICCRLEEEHLCINDDDTAGVFPADYVDTFLGSLKCFFVEGLVFPRRHMDSRYV